MLTTILGDAIPRYIQSNPSERRRGKGRKGHRRIARHESVRKEWATPLQALLVAERCSALSGRCTDFVMIITIAYTGMRWSEAIGLPVDCVHDEMLNIDWKLYELNGPVLQGPPKDGSMRPAELCAAGGHAIDPAALVLFSTRQYTARGFPFVPLTRDSQVHWVRGYSLTADRPAWLPASLVYVNWYGTRHGQGRPPTNGTFFPGIAAARSVPDAIAAGLLEVVERHATMTWWLNSHRLAKIAPTAEFDAAWGNGARSAVLRRWLIHLDNEFAIPVMADVLQDTAQSLLTVGFAARSDPLEAGLKAWAEALTLRELAIDLLDPDGGYRRMFARGRLPDQGVKPWRPDRGYLESYRPDFRDVISLICQAQVHLDPAAQALVKPLVDPGGTRQMVDLPTVAGADLPSYQSLVEARGYEIYFADITTADIACAGYHVVRTIVPGLVPNSPAAFPFLGLGAAQKAAVSLRWRDRPLAEEELNKVPLPHA